MEFGKFSLIKQIVVSVVVCVIFFSFPVMYSLQLFIFFYYFKVIVENILDFSFSDK